MLLLAVIIRHNTRYMYASACPPRARNRPPNSDALHAGLRSNISAARHVPGEPKLYHEHTATYSTLYVTSPTCRLARTDAPLAEMNQTPRRKDRVGKLLWWRSRGSCWTLSYHVTR